ncbi:AbiH family protein [Prolixibacteraceae bacterium]|nr:AbiH family protein [Prolixibacteraceae bacterium]
MNILYILGNGFDLQLGLKTSYYDFYQYYTNLNDDPSEPVKQVRKSIEDHISNKGIYSNWSDMELALGEYAKKIKPYNKEQYIEVIVDILNHLAEYLSGQEESLKKTPLAESTLRKFLYNQEFLFEGREKSKNIIIDFKKRSKDKSHIIDVITFNYTKSFEKLLPITPKSNFIKQRDINYIYNQTLHVHGTIDSNMVLGVDNVNQIANNDFAYDQEISDYIVKKTQNENTESLIDQAVEESFLRSNMICIYGTSMGETDKRWWELIGQHLHNNKECIVIICAYIEDTERQKINRRSAYYRKKKTELITEFMNKINNQEINDRILVSFSKDPFKIK